MAKELLRVEHIGMKFNLSKERVNDFREYVIRMLKGKKLEKDEFWALKDINFSIHEGERIGILGLNGAGKSTLLKVVAGVFKPTEGRVIRNGKIVPLLELGAGFDKNYPSTAPYKNILYRPGKYIFIWSSAWIWSSIHGRKI